MAQQPLTPVERAHILSVMEAETHYAALGVSGAASREEIEEAYRAYAREWHPDRFFRRDCGDLKQAIEQNFIDVSNGYTTLKDEKRRRAYDEQLVASGKMAMPAVERSLPPASARPAPERTSRPTANFPTPSLPKAPPPPEEPEHEVVLQKTAGGFRPAPQKKAAAEPLRPVEPPRPPPPAAVARLRAQVAEQMARAAAYFKAGKEDYDAGRFVKAESNLYLAKQHDPKNQAYQALYQLAAERSRLIRAEQYFTQADQALQIGREKEAIAALQKAVECDPPNGKAAFRLAKLQKGDVEASEIMGLLRKAVQKEPKVLEYRVALAELYIDLNMRANAQREVQAASEIDPKDPTVKAVAKRLKA